MSGRPQPGDPDFPYMLADTPEEFERVRRAAWPAPSPATAGLPAEDVERVARALLRAILGDTDGGLVLDGDLPAAEVARLIREEAAAAALAEMRPTAEAACGHLSPALHVGQGQPLAPLMCELSYGHGGAHEARNGDLPPTRWAAVRRGPDSEADEDECEHHSWAGLMALLDEHWPDDIFPTRYEDDPKRGAGPRIVSLMRWVDELRAKVTRVEALAAEWERDGWRTWTPEAGLSDPGRTQLDAVRALSRALDGTP